LKPKLAIFEQTPGKVNQDKDFFQEVNYRRLKAGGIPLHRCPIEQTYKGSSAHVFVLIASIYFGEVNLRYLHCFMTQCKGSIQPLPEGQRYNLPLDPNAIKHKERSIASFNEFLTISWQYVNLLSRFEFHSSKA
jgi:hypothetical protein